jgi:uncharacterized membrane protein
MTGNEFIAQLKKHLRGLPPEETAAAIEFYEEYISDAGEGNDEAALAKLGTPAEVAAKIIADFAVKPVAESEKSAKRGMSKVWIVILAIFASPIALPLAISAAAVAFSLLVSLFALFLSFAVTGIALIAAGILYFVAGVIIVFQNIPMALFAAGGGLLAAGLGIALTKIIVKLSKISFDGLARIFGKFILRRTAK